MMQRRRIDRAVCHWLAGVLHVVCSIDTGEGRDPGQSSPLKSCRRLSGQVSTSVRAGA